MDILKSLFERFIAPLYKIPNDISDFKNAHPFIGASVDWLSDKAHPKSVLMIINGTVVKPTDEEIGYWLTDNPLDSGAFNKVSFDEIELVIWDFREKRTVLTVSTFNKLCKQIKRLPIV